MPDIEKVISDLNDLIYREREYLAEIGQTEPSGIERILGDAIALLKVHKPVKPIRINSITDGLSFVYACGKCCHLLPRIGVAAKYCTNCGTAVNWNEAD